MYYYYHYYCSGLKNFNSFSIHVFKSEFQLAIHFFAPWSIWRAADSIFSRCIEYVDSAENSCASGTTKEIRLPLQRFRPLFISYSPRPPPPRRTKIRFFFQQTLLPSLDVPVAAGKSLCRLVPAGGLANAILQFSGSHRNTTTKRTEGAAERFAN